MTAPLDERLFDAEPIARLIALALEEDLGQAGDVTGRVLPESATCRGTIVFRQPGVLAGLPLAERILARLDPTARLTRLAQDGERLAAGQPAATIEGDARGVLAAERTVLNFLQRLSGTATATRAFADAVAGTAARVFDTRKTCPGWRLLEKYAVRAGGGANHRMGLYDQVLIKDNHLAVWGGEAAVPQVVARAREAAPAGTPVEVEVTTAEGALAAARAGADIVLLDNFEPEALAAVVRAVREDAGARGAPPPELEASGGISLETIRAFAEAGVDRISTGWITHSAPALDIALDLELRAEVGA